MHNTPRTISRIVTLTLAVTLLAACSKEARKAQLLGEADNYFKAGDYDKARVSYLNIVQLDPQNALAFERIGAIWQDDAAPLRALPFLQRASALNPEHVSNRMRLARCYSALGQFEEAKKEALKLLEQAPDNGDALVALAEAAHSREDIEAAGKQIEKFPKKNDVSFHLATANLLLNQGNLAAAGEALRQALAIDPGSSRAHLAMGDLYFFQKDPKQAGEEYKKAADLAPLRSIERLKYAAFKSGVGDAGETKRVATEMTKRAPDYLPGWVLLAESASKEKKYDEALSLLENVFSRDPDYIDGRRLQSEVFLAKGDKKKAVEVVERLDHTYPGVPLVKYQLARVYLADNNVNPARLVLEQILSANPNFQDAVVLLAEINVRTGHADLAIEPLTRLLQRNPELRNVALLLSAAYLSLDRPDDAAAVMDDQAWRTPRDPQAQMALGLILRQAKRNDEARKAFEKASELAPDSLWPVEQLVDLDLLDKHFDVARQRVQHQFQKTPDAPAAHYFQGKILAAEKKWDTAEAELQRTLRLDPNFAAAYDLLVQTYLAQNKLAQAVSQVESELAKNPDYWPALMTLALLYEHTQDFTKARDAYEKLLAINPNFASAANNLAYLYAERLNDLDKAYDLARKARELQGDNPAVNDTLGWVLYKRGDYQQALPILQESAQKLPDNPEIQFHLGMTAYMMGETDLARVALKKAANAAKDFPGKGESKRRLALLESGAGSSPQLSISQLETMTKEQPNDLMAQLRLGEAYEKQGAPDKAAAAFEQAAKLNPKLAPAVIKLAQLYAGPLHNNDKALAYAKEARELAPTDPQVAGILGKVAYQSGNFPWAYSLLQEAVRQRQNDAALVHDLAWAAYSLGKVNEARDTMQKILTTAPESTEAGDAKKFLAVSALDEDPGRLAAAEAEVQKELKSNPDYVPVLMAEAAMQAQRGQTKEAIEIYSSILRRFPDFAPAQKRLAALYARDPALIPSAYDLAIKARKTLPDDPELATLLGRLSYERKEYPRAVQLLQESARKRPLDADALFYLGMSQLQTREKAEAQGALNQALSAGLQDPLASEARRALADLERE
jgi:tetratricopeptide (TPR) repeat protein